MSLFSIEQTEVMQELANFIKLKGLVINNDKDLKIAFSQYLQSNDTNFYFKADETQKENFVRAVKNKC